MLFKMEAIFMNTLNSKTNESNKFIYQLTDKLNLKNPNKNMALANLSIYYTRKNIKSEYNNNKFKIHALTWKDEFNLADGTYSISDTLYILIFYISDILIFYVFILNTSSKNMKLLQKILLYKFM